MHHFFVPKAQISTSTVDFPTDIAHQIKRVLRLREGELVNVLDNQGNIYLTSIVFNEDSIVQGQIQKKSKCDSEPTTKLSLYVGLTQREKFEWILQKSTELGVARFIPFISERSLVQKASSADKKEQRWQKIIREAAEQSKRGHIPVLEPAVEFRQALIKAVEENDVCMIPWEETKSGSISAVLGNSKPERVAILIGPEGGFSAEEIRLAEDYNVTPVTLGKRILRMETAALAAAAMVMFHLGEME